MEGQIFYTPFATPRFEGNPSSDTSIFKGQGPPRQGRKSDQNKGLNWVTGIHMYVQYFDWILENRWFLVFMEEIPNNRLGCIKPGNGLNYQSQLVSRIFSINSMYCLVISPLHLQESHDTSGLDSVFQLGWCPITGMFIYIYIYPLSIRLGGVFFLQKFVDFHPKLWGNDPIWRAYFSDGLVQPPTSIYHLSIRLIDPFSWAKLPTGNSATWKQIRAD